MLIKVISRLRYYINIFVNKPYLILSLIYKKHLGVILLIPIGKSMKNKELKSDIKVEVSASVEEIYGFYKKMKRDSITKEKIEKWISENNECFLIYEGGKAIGGMWIFKDEIQLKNISGRTLSAQKNIRLNKNTIYGAYGIIDETHRGKGLNQIFFNHILIPLQKPQKYCKTAG